MHPGRLQIINTALLIINYYRLIQIQATFGFKVCLCAAALQLSSSVPMNKKNPIKYSITGAKKCKTESSREWVGLDQSRPVSQQILMTSLPKALTTLAFQTSWTSVQLKVRWELGSMKLNTPNLIIQQHMDQRKPGTQQTCLNKVNTWQALGETRRSCHAVSLLSLPGQRII